MPDCKLLCFFLLFPSLCSLSLQGIVKALQEYQKKLLEHKVQIYVRRGGPNYQEGLRVMREVGKKGNWSTPRGHYREYPPGGGV